MRRAVPPMMPRLPLVGYSFKVFLAFIGCILLFKASVVEAFFVPSGSMVPTLAVRDYILVPKFIYGLRLPFFNRNIIQWRVPSRGDVVVFTRADDPRTKVNESTQDLVKRVIALPGDIVEVNGPHVFINGKELEEPYAKWLHSGFAGGRFGPARVPQGEVFLLGDNRDESSDSRFWSYPFVDTKRLKGRAMMVYWSGLDVSRVGTIVH